MCSSDLGALLVRRLMDLSESRQAGLVDCAEAVAATARRARLAAPRSVAVEVRVSDAPLRAALDGAGLESALLNLCVNASHAIPAGGTIMLTAQEWILADLEAQDMNLRAGRYVVVSVADTGPGMAPEVLAQATEAVFTTRRGRGGSGLGLAGVRDFAEACGGRFVLTSREGRGATARLFLPSA